jgi:hypothetical protein
MILKKVAFCLWGILPMCHLAYEISVGKLRNFLGNNSCIFHIFMVNFSKFSCFHGQFSKNGSFSWLIYHKGLFFVGICYKWYYYHGINHKNSQLPMHLSIFCHALGKTTQSALSKFCKFPGPHLTV